MIKEKKKIKYECIENYGTHVADIKTVNNKIKCFFCGKDLGKQRPAE